MTISMPSIGVRIRIDVPHNFLNSEAFERGLPEAVMDAALEARNFWESEAGRRLTSTRIRYQEAIAMEQGADDSVTLLLKGKFAQSVEQGYSGFSMRQGFLNSPKIKTGPIKIPRAVAASLKKTGVKATRWMIIPLNVDRSPVFSNPKVFRTFTDAQPPSMWMHPGHQGVHIAPDVIEELRNSIMPKHVRKLIDEVFK